MGNNGKNIKNKNKKSFVPWLLILMGLVFIAVSVFLFQLELRFLREGIEIDALITRIEVTEDSDGDTSHNVYVDYEVDGKEYTGRNLGTYTAGMYEGKTIRIRYLPGQPTKIAYAEFELAAPVAFAAAGLIVLLFGIVPPVLKAAKSGKLGRLKKNGREIEATISEINVKYNVTVLGKHPLKLVCTDAHGYTFTSHAVYEDEHLFKIGDKITVYYDPRNEKNAMIDVPGYLKGTADETQTINNQL